MRKDLSWEVTWHLNDKDMKYIKDLDIVDEPCPAYPC